MVQIGSSTVMLLLGMILSVVSARAGTAAALISDKAMFGWPCDEKIQKLRDDYAKETDPAKQKAIAEAVQVRVTEYPTHVHLGQWYSPFAVRTTVDGIVEAPVTVFWNVSKK